MAINSAQSHDAKWCSLTRVMHLDTAECTWPKDYVRASQPGQTAWIDADADKPQIGVEVKLSAESRILARRLGVPFFYCLLIDLRSSIPNQKSLFFWSVLVRSVSPSHIHCTCTLYPPVFPFHVLFQVVFVTRFLSLLKIDSFVPTFRKCHSQ